jgi:addiction module RelB/DinJ family antitoxin
MALIQLNVPDDVKERADAAFARSGLTTPYAMRIMVNQVAETGRTPFDGLFSSPAGRQYSDDVRLAMLRAEAQEYGLLEDDAAGDPLEIPADILAEMGISPEEVGQ